MCSPFLHFKQFEYNGVNCIRKLSFLRLEESIGRVSVLIDNFVGVNLKQEVK